MQGKQRLTYSMASIPSKRNVDTFSALAGLNNKPTLHYLILMFFADILSENDMFEYSLFYLSVLSYIYRRTH